MGLNDPKLPPGTARGAYQRKRGGAMYGMQQTIAKAMGGNKAPKFALAKWNYEPRKMTLVKATDLHK